MRDINCNELEILCGKVDFRTSGSRFEPHPQRLPIFHLILGGRSEFSNNFRSRPDCRQKSLLGNSGVRGGGQNWSSVPVGARRHFSILFRPDSGPPPPPQSARFPCENANLPHCTYFTHIPPPPPRYVCFYSEKRQIHSYRPLFCPHCMAFLEREGGGWYWYMFFLFVAMDARSLRAQCIAAICVAAMWWANVFHNSGGEKLTRSRFHQKGAFFQGKGASRAPHIPHRHPTPPPPPRPLLPPSPLWETPYCDFQPPTLVCGGAGGVGPCGIWERARPLYREKRPLFDENAFPVQFRRGFKRGIRRVSLSLSLSLSLSEVSRRKKAHKHKLFALVNVQMALRQAAGCPRVNRAKQFMCSPRNTGNISVSLWLTGGCPRVVPTFQKFMCSKFMCLFLALKSYAWKEKSCLQNTHFDIQKGPLFETPFKAFKLDQVSFHSWTTL